MKSTVRSAAGPAALAATAQPARVAAGGGGPSERLQSGNFSSSTGWSGSAWTIASGVATNTAANQFLVGTLVPPIANGNSVSVSLGVTGNPNAVAWMLFLYNTTTLASQTVITEAGGIPGTFSNSVTASGDFDAVRIRAIGDAGLVIDDVSVIA